MIGHDGSLPGYQSFMGYDPDTGNTLTAAYPTGRRSLHGDRPLYMSRRQSAYSPPGGSRRRPPSSPCPAIRAATVDTGLRRPARDFPCGHGERAQGIAVIGRSLPVVEQPAHVHSFNDATTTRSGGRLLAARSRSAFRAESSGDTQCVR
jgi:hypothetical protein